MSRKWWKDILFRQGGSLLTLLLGVAALGCERNEQEMWVPGMKPTAYSAHLRQAQPVQKVGTAQPQETPEMKGEQDSATSTNQAMDLKVMPQLKEILSALGTALKASDRSTVEEQIRRAQALDQEAVGRLTVRIVKANEGDLGVPAARLIGRLKLRVGLRSLYDRLIGEDIFMAQAAAEALGEMGDPTSVKYLADQAKRNASASIRSAALEAMGKIGDKTGLPLVIDSVKDPDPSVREAAAHIIGKLGTPQEHHELLFSLMKDPAPRVRLMAVLSLADLRAPEALDSLVDLLADSSEEVRRSAEGALVAFPDRTSVRRKLLDALEQRDGSALLNYSQALTSVCDCSCVQELNRIAGNTTKPTVKNACTTLAAQIGAGCK